MTVPIYLSKQLCDSRPCWRRFLRTANVAWQHHFIRRYIWGELVFVISDKFLYLGSLQPSSVLPGPVPQLLFSPKPFHPFYECMCLGDPRQQGLKAVADPLPSLYSLCLRLLLPGRLLRNCLLCRIFYQLSTVCYLVRWFAVVLVFLSLDSNCQNTSLLEFAVGNTGIWFSINLCQIKIPDWSQLTLIHEDGIPVRCGDTACTPSSLPS